MPKFSKRSLDNLEGVHQDLQTIFLEVVKHYDCTVICGLRTEEEQKALHAKGRTESGEIVTYKDGVNSKSKHQLGLAVDVIPYPINWGDIRGFRQFGWFVKGVAVTLKRYGQIENDINWGGDWKRFIDLPHYQI